MSNDKNEKHPITPAQAEARRNNGKRYSTGPRTAAGKRASSRNAVRHGLWAKADPVVDTGIFAEDPKEFADLRDALHGHYGNATPLLVELVDDLASVLWRLKRVPAIEALLLQEVDSIEDRRTDRDREKLEEIQLTVAFLREGGYLLDEESYYIVMGNLQLWSGWPFAEGWSGEEPMVTAWDEQIALADRLLHRRFASWDEAADHGQQQAADLEDDLGEDRLRFAIYRANRLVKMDVLSKLNRPEAHLARQRDGLLTQIRAELARTEQLEEDDE
jgi:hypothetical protein